MHVWEGVAGWVSTLTLYVAPLLMAALKANGPFADTLRLLPPPFCNTKPDPDNPDTTPPMRLVLVRQLTVMFVTSESLTVPALLLTEQV